MAKKQKNKKLNYSNPKKVEREVKVVTCPSAFPISTKAGKRSRDEDCGLLTKEASFTGGTPNKNKLLDLHETAKEIKAYGATAFIGRQKRDYEDEKYLRLTGRHKKKQKVPLPLLRGLE